MLLTVWPLPRSLATTSGISVDFFSSPYLDVSVQAVPRVHLCIQCTLTEYCSAGFPHSEIHGYNAYLRLPMAYRSLSRPSSALSAKAFPLRPLQLNLFVAKSASLRFQASLKTARAPLLLTSNSDPLTLGSKFVSGAVPDHGRSQVYLQELGLSRLKC